MENKERNRILFSPEFREVVKRLPEKENELSSLLERGEQMEKGKMTTIKVSDLAAKRLKILAANQGMTMVAMIEEVVAEAFKQSGLPDYTEKPKKGLPKRDGFFPET